MEDCVFCRIIRGELPARMVHEDEFTVAFWDARPASPIHILIVPRVHIATLNDVPDGHPLLCHMTDTAKKIARSFGVAESGYRFFINVNRGGGQVIFHLHAHLVAGQDFGTLFIRIGIAAAIVWRRFVGLFRHTAP